MLHNLGRRLNPSLALRRSGNCLIRRSASAASVAGKCLLVATLSGAMQGRSAEAQVVQLPSFRSFSYSGGVLVPDRGSALLGGSSSALDLPGFRSHRHAGMSVHATIIDLDEMDRQILGYDPDQLREQVRSGAIDPAASRSGRAMRTPRAVVDEAKQKVRLARRLTQFGDHLGAKHAYRQAVEALERVAATKVTLDGPYDAAELATFARQELASVYPDPATISEPVTIPDPTAGETVPAPAPPPYLAGRHTPSIDRPVQRAAESPR